MAGASDAAALHRRQRIHEVLAGASEVDPYAMRFKVTIVILIVASTFANVLQTVEAYRLAHAQAFQVIEIITTAIFTAEYFLRLWSYGGSMSRARYALKPMMVVDLLSFLPLFLGLLLPIDDYLLVTLRAVRLLKLARYSVAVEIIAEVVKSQWSALLGSAAIMLILLVFAASLGYLFEHEGQPAAFADLPSAMWWAIVTLTTVGYGDVTPLTLGGRILGGFCMVMGIGMLALPTGILATGFVTEFQKRDFVVSWRLVAQVPLFAGLDALKIAEIVDLLRPKMVPENFTIVRRGEPADAMYFIVSGEVEVVMQPEGKLLREGDYFGEIALLTATQRSATVRAITTCRLLSLGVKDFKNLLVQIPALRETLTKAMHDRLKELSAASEG
jgi:voltage-gated potassium channel